jgi:putative hydrolase of the HAD superfamily
LLKNWYHKIEGMKMFGKTIHVFFIAVFMITTVLQSHYKHIIFDFGGVLLDGSPCHGIELVKSESWLSWMKGEITQQDLVEQLSRTFHRQEIVQLLENTLSDKRPWIDETCTLVRKLKDAGYGVYLLSNLAQEVHQKFVASNPMFITFDGILCSFQAGYIKPDHRIYYLLCERYGLAPEECIFIDDFQSNVDAAEAVGITGILYRKGCLASALLQLGLEIEQDL